MNFLYLWKVNPFKEKSVQRIEFFNELCVIGAGLISYALSLTFTDVETVVLLSWMIIGLILLMAVVNWIFIIYYQLKELYIKLKSKK
jgi:hypothetical protein